MSARRPPTASCRSTCSALPRFLVRLRSPCDAWALRSGLSRADAALTAEQRTALLETHVARSTSQVSRLVRETAALYDAAHAPLIKALPPAALGWVYKILAREKEQERLLHDTPGDDGFLMNVDPKARAVLHTVFLARCSSV